MDSIMEDVADTIDFIRTKLPADVADKVDVDRLATCGGSAGGWLSLLAGTGIVRPPPKVVLAIYPITGSTDAFFTTPQKPKVSYEAAPVDRQVVAPYLDPKADVSSSSTRFEPRVNMYS
jgi:acetyl esterase/lipase